MKEEFEEGELVEVRDYDYEEWIPAVYVGVLPGYNWYWTRAIDVNKNSEASPMRWKQIRKIQKPDTTKQRIDSFEAKLNAVHERFKKELERIKKTLEEDND